MSDEVTLRATKDIPGIRARLVDTGYKTRRLKAGDDFIVSDTMARLLVNGLKKAEYYRKPGKVAAPSASVVKAAKAGAPARTYKPQLDHDKNGENGGATSAKDDAVREIDLVRAEYQRVVGKRPFSGWNVATLREKMAAAGK